MKHRILIVEDEFDLARGLEINLRNEGYEVLKAATGDAGVKLAFRESPHLVLLDVMLPGMSGFDVCRELRQRGFEAPIFMLTAKGEEIDRVVGLEIGADDYVTKPFGMAELLARLRAVLRARKGGGEEESPIFQTGGRLRDQAVRLAGVAGAHPGAAAAATPAKRRGPGEVPLWPGGDRL
jgi:two-component system, OmpR family, response regulator RegX3